jgi:molybdenum cofactor cytidylyltransferase
MLRRSQLRALVVTNSAWQSGISSSLERSLTALPADADAALITLADQALISTPDLKRLETKWRCNPGRCAAAEYAGQLGVPAIIPRKYWGAIRLLDGDIGARRVLRSFPRIVAVALPNAAFDVDTAADANELGLT